MTILRGVRTIIILAIQRQARRTLAHVGEEVLERLPTFTNDDATTTVIGMTTTAGVHRKPTYVSCGWFTIPPMAVRRVQCSDDFAPQTAARSYLSVSQVPTIYNHLVAAVANTKPSSALVSLKNSKATETLIRDIDESGHGEPPTRLLCQVADG